MRKKETPLHQLQQYLPPDTFQMVAPYFNKYTIHLTLTRDRKTVLGDYREPTAAHPKIYKTNELAKGNNMLTCT